MAAFNKGLEIIWKLRKLFLKVYLPSEYPTASGWGIRRVNKYND